MKRTGLNIICSLLLVGGMCACTATPKHTIYLTFYTIFWVL